MRALGPVMATAVVVGTVIGSGVFKKPGVIAEKVEYSGLVGVLWVLGGLLVVAGALAYAEVCILLPRAGGNYVFLREGYGRLFGFLWGWVEFWIIRSASIAALATIFVESLNDILRSPGIDWPLGFWAQKLTVVAAIVGLAWVNVRGVRWGGGLQVFITIVKVGSLLVILALPFVALAVTMRSRPDPANLNPIWPEDWSAVRLGGLGSAFLGVLWAYHGWMNIAPVAEEVRSPQRNIPLALLGGVAIIVFLYLGANVAYYSMITGPEMAALKKTNTPVATDMFLRLLGPVGTLLASAAIMCSVFGALNGNLLVGPRLLYAMGDDGLAPQGLRAVHPRYRTPAAAIWVMGAWSALWVLAVALLSDLRIIDPEKTNFDYLTNLAMFGAVIFETMAVVSIFVFRRTMPDAPRPYRCWGYPVVPALYVILPACMVVNYFVNERTEALLAGGIIAVGVLVYYLMGLEGTRPRVKRLEDLPPGARAPFESTVSAQEVTTDQRSTTRRV
jgi:amino acid transporter